MGFPDLPSVVLKHIALTSMEYTDIAAQDGSRMLAGPKSASGCLNAEHSYFWISNEGIKQPHGVASAADASDEIIRQPSLLLENLPTCFLSDHRLKVTHHHRIGMRAGYGTDQIVSIANVGHPIPQRLVHGIFQGLTAGIHHPHLGAEFLRQALGKIEGGFPPRILMEIVLEFFSERPLTTHLRVCPL